MRSKANVKQRLNVGLKDDVVSYLSETTVHGFRYIVVGRNIIERVVWVIFLSIAFLFTYDGIRRANLYWDTHPVETTKDEVGLPVHELPFPAITISDPTSLTIPRKNRWMFLETFLNSLELINPEEELKYMYPGDK